MTTLKDYLWELIDEAVELGQIAPVDLGDKKLELLYDYLKKISERVIGYE